MLSVEQDEKVHQASDDSGWWAEVTAERLVVLTLLTVKLQAGCSSNSATYTTQHKL